MQHVRFISKLESTTLFHAPKGCSAQAELVVLRREKLPRNSAHSPVDYLAGLRRYARLR